MSYPRQEVPYVERYITRQELALLMGVSVNTVDRLRKAGMPSVLWGRRSRRFLPSEALAWAQDEGARDPPERQG